MCEHNFIIRARGTEYLPNGDPMEILKCVACQKVWTLRDSVYLSNEIIDEIKKEAQIYVNREKSHSGNRKDVS